MSNTNDTTKNKIYMLKPKEKGLYRENNPWYMVHDKSFGFVVRANSYRQARKFADNMAGDENNIIDNVRPWLDSRYSTCKLVHSEGENGVILQNYHVD